MRCFPPCTASPRAGAEKRWRWPPYPYSDLDLLFLFDPADSAEATHIAEFILYVLWDLGLKVGQAHRTVDECIELARQDFTIRTSLLDARLIEGGKTLFDHFSGRFASEILSGEALQFVEAKLTERDARHQRFGDSRYMLEPNVKEGKGGLRDLHTLWWMTRYLYPIRRMRDLVHMKLLTEEEFATFNQARQFLWRVRIHLHYQCGRAEDRITFDRQHALAVAMGYAHPSSNRAIERFMRRYFVAVRTVGSMTRVYCAILEEEKNRKPRKSLAWLWHKPWALGHFRLDGERLTVRSEQAFEQHPLLMIEIFHVAQAHGLDIHPRALQLMARSLRRIDNDLQHDARAGELFMDILLGDHAEVTLRRMSEAGVLGRFIPDFGRIVGQTQFNMYHVYTVDEHTLVALGILHNIEKGEVNAELPLATDIVHRIKMRRVLHLALFCHDIAKGRGGDHSELGEKVAAKLAVRFGFSKQEAETTAWLVRYHLLFSNTAFKRD
ncbi:MAG: [protein-PII] uridylyltransferase, partial [Proteobacteria bacterium]|nr:[protein-PII] uridylyltransferase [Pseudomonadota bacterium]